MNIIPKSYKFSKKQKGRISNIYKGNQSLSFGEYGIMSLNAKVISNNTLSALEKVLKRELKPHGRLWLRVFPHFPVTKKPIEVRMGKGKGSINHWVTNIRAGQILIEFNTTSLIIAKKIYKLTNTKLSIQMKLISRN